MQYVPLQPIPNQAVTISLGGQNCQINVYQKFYGLFVDLYVDNVLIIGGVIGLNINLIVISTYLGFIGDLTFVDTQGTSDPSYTELGTRWQLVYLEATDIAAFNLPVGES